jgi:hypothetical protein
VNFTQVVEMIVASTDEDEYLIDWGMAKIVSSEAKGIPVAIGVSIAKETQTMAQAAEGDTLSLRMETAIDDSGVVKEPNKK